MALPGIPIPETQCIGDSLFSINNALTALDDSIMDLINAGASVTVSALAPTTGLSLGDLWYDSDNGILSVYYDSQWVDVGAGGGGGGISEVTGTAPITVTNGTTAPAISIATATTGALGVAELATLAEVQSGTGTNTIVTPANLFTLLNTLSTNIMNTIGNYPYLEYAYVTTCAYAGQVIDGATSGILQTVLINTKVHDTHSIGSNPSGNIISLPAGTYEYNLIVPYTINPASWANSWQASVLTYLMNGSTPIAIERAQIKMVHTSSRNTNTNMSGRFKITSTSNISVETKKTEGTSDVVIGLFSGNANDETFDVGDSTDPAWATRLKLWKVA